MLKFVRALSEHFEPRLTVDTLMSTGRREEKEFRGGIIWCEEYTDGNHMFYKYGVDGIDFQPNAIHISVYFGYRLVDGAVSIDAVEWERYAIESTHISLPSNLKWDNHAFTGELIITPVEPIPYGKDIFLSTII
jgi:hypothetical protein